MRPDLRRADRLPLGPGGGGGPPQHQRVTAAAARRLARRVPAAAWPTSSSTGIPTARPRRSAGRSADSHGVGPEQVFCANGSNEVLQSLLLAYGGPGRTVALFEPTYTLHRHIARITGTAVAAGRRTDDFRLDLDEVRRVRRDADDPVITFLCSPNNPTGPGRAARADRGGAGPGPRACWWWTRPTGSSLRRRPSTWCSRGGPGHRPGGGGPDLLQDMVAWPASGSATWSPRPRWSEACELVALPYHLDAAKQLAGRLALQLRATRWRPGWPCSRRSGGGSPPPWPTCPSRPGRRTPTSSSSGPSAEAARQVWTDLLEALGARARLFRVAGPRRMPPGHGGTPRGERPVPGRPERKPAMTTVTPPTTDPGAEAAAARRATKETSIEVDPGRRRHRDHRGVDRSALLRPHGQPAGPPRRLRPRRGGPRRPRGRRPPHRRGRGDHPGRGAGRGPGGQGRASAGSDRSPCPSTRRWSRWRSTCPAGRSSPTTSSSPRTPPRSGSPPFDPQLAEEFWRAFATAAGLTLHIQLRERQEHPPHPGGVVQGGGAGAAGRRPRRGRGHPLHQGDAVNGPDAVGGPVAGPSGDRPGDRRSSTTASATSARRRRPSSTWGPMPSWSTIPTGPPTADGVVLPGVGAFGRCAQALRASGLDRAAAVGRRAGRAVPRDLRGLPAPLRGIRRGPAGTGLGDPRRHGPAPARRGQASPDAVEPARSGDRGEPPACCAGLPRAGLGVLRATPSPPRSPPTPRRPASTEAPVTASAERGAGVGHPVPPREVRIGRAAASWPTSWMRWPVRPTPPPGDGPLSGHRHPRRGCRPAHPGRLRPRDRLRRPRGPGPPLRRRRRPVAARGRPRRRPPGQPGEPAHGAGHRRRRRRARCRPVAASGRRPTWPSCSTAG